MISKVEVRKRLYLYEDTIREEQKLVEAEMKSMREACLTTEMVNILRNSKEYAKLSGKLEVLHDVKIGLIDLRCEEMFNDY